MFRGEHMWIVAKTRPNQEYRAELNLCNQGFECYIPEISSKKFVNNVWKDIKEKMFTGYLFIKLNKKIKNLHKKNLIDVILLLNSEKKLLTEKISRDLLIDALKQNEAEIIGKLFKINSQNIWKSLKDLNFKNKKILELFLSIFEIKIENKKIGRASCRERV